LCTCFWRNSANLAHVSLANSPRRTLPGKYISLIFSCGVLLTNGAYGLMLTFICARTGSLYLYSSWFLVRTFGVLFLLTTSQVLASVQLEKSYFLQFYKTNIFQNAYIFSSELAGAILGGLNVTYLIHLVLSKIISSDSSKCGPIGVSVSLILAGRIKGYTGTKSVSGLTIFPRCFSVCNRILDLGCVSFGSSLGCFGVKVGIFL